jgi:hypothetical protein
MLCPDKGDNTIPPDVDKIELLEKLKLPTFNADKLPIDVIPVYDPLNLEVGNIPAFWLDESKK